MMWHLSNGFLFDSIWKKNQIEYADESSIDLTQNTKFEQFRAAGVCSALSKQYLYEYWTRKPQNKQYQAAK